MNDLASEQLAFPAIYSDIDIPGHKHAVWHVFSLGIGEGSLYEIGYMPQSASRKFMWA